MLHNFISAHPSIYISSFSLQTGETKDLKATKIVSLYISGFKNVTHEIHVTETSHKEQKWKEN